MEKVDPKVVIIQHGRWYPEQAESDPDGWLKFSTNILTNKIVHSADPGAPNLRRFLYNVYKVDGREIGMIWCEPEDKVKEKVANGQVKY
jgi:hypothetical protein